MGNVMNWAIPIGVGVAAAACEWFALGQFDGKTGPAPGEVRVEDSRVVIGGVSLPRTLEG